MPDFEVALAGHRVEPLQQMRQQDDAETGDVFQVLAWLVQLHAPPSAADANALKARHRLALTEYVPDLAYVERLTRGRARLLRRDPLVRAVLHFESRFKVSPLLAGLDELLEHRAAIVDVKVFDDADLDDVIHRLAVLDVVPRAALDDRPRGGHATLRVVLTDPAQARQISGIPEVRWLEPGSEVVDDAVGTVGMIGAPGHQGLSTAWDHGLHGERQVLGLLDNGLPDLGHCFFRDPAVAQPGTTHRKIHHVRDASGTPPGGHASFVAGCLAGDSWEQPGLHPWRGAAWAARLVCGSHRDLATTTLLTQLTRAAGYGAIVHSNSWHSRPQGSGAPAVYDAHAIDVDTFTWLNEDHLVIGSSGHAGTELGSPGTAKNALCVSAGRRAPESSELGDGASGPTVDGRRKPDLMAAGCGVHSALPGSGCDIGPHDPCSSSYAAPVAAGAAALVRQYFEDGKSLGSARQDGGYVAPTGALVKAMLVGSTVVPGALPSGLVDGRGWGAIDLGRVLDFGESTRRLLVHDVRHASGLVTGDAWTADLLVSSGMPLVVVLVWTDPPGAPGADPVVNDLDLVLTNPAGDSYLGNVTVGGSSVVGGQPDRRNNVEVVAISDPAPGRWQVGVRAERVNAGRPGQGYAVVITGQATWETSYPFTR
ncbi:MAG TPA: S8 family serine peptidase [Nocardioides sp.]|nr:S8 family serine peptidase [Nocardioides sp.]